MQENQIKDESRKRELRESLWAQTEMPIVRFLDELRAMIIGGDDPPKRLPKWRLKLGEGLGVELQPKDSARTLFQGRAFEGSGLSAATFSEKRDDHRHLRQLAFRIFQGAGCWLFKASSVNYSSDDNVRYLADENGCLIREEPGALEARKEAAFNRCIELKNRIIEALNPDFCADRLALLSQNCLICGRGLTDPVSRMRMIGPECWGKAGVNAPLLTRTPERNTDLAQTWY